MAIQLKRSSTAGLVPAAAELADGEVAINTADLELYAENTVGEVHRLDRPSFPRIKPLSGEWFTPMIVNNTLSTQAMTANRAYWHPFVAGHNMTFDRVSIWVTTAVASSLARVALFASDSDGRPTGTALYESADMDCATTGEKFDTAAVSIRRGLIYWYAVHANSTQTLRAMLRTETICIHANPNTAYPNSMLYNSQSFALGCPAPGSFTYTNINIPLAYWRLA